MIIDNYRYNCVVSALYWVPYIYRLPLIRIQLDKLTPTPHWRDEEAEAQSESVTCLKSKSWGHDWDWNSAVFTSETPTLEPTKWPPQAGSHVFLKSEHLTLSSSIIFLLGTKEASEHIVGW